MAVDNFISITDIQDPIEFVDLNAQNNLQQYPDDIKNNDYDLQDEAFGEVFPDLEYGRELAATDMLVEEDEIILDAAQQKLYEGESPKNVEKFLRETASKDPEFARNYALEYLAGAASRNKAMTDNSELVEKETLDSYLQSGQFVADELAKNNIDNTMLNTARVGMAEAGLGRLSKDILVRVVPFVQAAKDAMALDVGSSISPLEIRNRQKEIIRQARVTLSPEEYAGFLRVIDENIQQSTSDVVTRADFWEDMFTYNSTFEDVMQAMDVVGVAGLIGKAGKAVSISDKLVAAGNKKKMVERTIGLLDSLDRPSTATEELIEHAITPSALQAADNKSLQSYVSVMDKDVTANARNREAVQAFKEVFKARSMSPEEEARNLRLFTDDFKKKLPDEVAKVFDTNFIDVNRQADGSRQAVITLGSGRDGTGHFASDRSARAFAERNTNLLKGEYNVVKDSEGYLIKARYTVPDYGVSAETSEWAKEGKAFKAKGIERFIFGRKNVPSEFHQADVIAIRSKAQMQTISKNLKKQVDSLNKKDMEMLDAIQKKSLNEEKWYTVDELKSVGVNDTVINAYNAFKDASDLDFWVSNNVSRKRLGEQGYRMIEPKVGDKEGFFGKVVDSLEDPAITTFKDLNTGTVYDIGQMTKNTLEELKKSGKVIIKSHNAEELNFNKPIKYYIVNAGDVVSKDLPQNVIQYVAGGRRIYSPGTLFAKMPRVTYSNGRKIILKPKALFADVDKAAIRTKADEMNRALDIYSDYLNKKLTDTQAGALLNEVTASNKYFRVNSLDDMKKYIRSSENPEGVLDPAFRIEIVADKEDLAAVRQLRKEGAILLDDADDYVVNSVQDLVDANGRGFWKRGEWLKDVGEDFARTVSVEDVMAKTINKMINTNTYSDYNTWYARQFKRLYGDIINPEDLAKMSDIELLKNGRLLDTSAATMNKGLRNKIKAAKNCQQHWQILSNQSTEWDKTVDTYMRYLADALDESSFIKKTGLFQRGSKSYEWLATAKPDKFMRGFTFHMYLGMFNPRQLWLQASGANNILMLEPKAGAKAFGLYGPIRAALASKNPETFNAISKVALKLTGTSEAEFKELMKVLRKINAFDAKEIQGMQDARHVMRTDSFTNSSTFFFEEGERFNFINANTAAYFKWKQLHPGKTPSSYEELAQIVEMSDDLYLNMSKASETVLQKGTKIPTQLFAQFTAYPIRFMEAMLGKQFTAAQKTRLILGNIALYGLSGTLGLNAYDWIRSTGMSPEASEAMSRGLADYWLRELGIDVSVSEVGPDLFEKIAQLVGEEGVQMPQVPAFSGIQGIYSFFELASKILFPETSSVDLKNVMMWAGYESKLPSSLRNGTKALLAWSTGKLYTSKYEILKDDVSSFEAVLYGLGFRSGTQEAISEVYEHMAAKDKVINDCKTDLTRAWNKFIQTGSDNAYQEYQILYKGILESLDDPVDKTRLMKLMSGVYKRSPMPKLDAQMWRLLKTEGMGQYIEMRKRQGEEVNG